MSALFELREALNVDRFSSNAIALVSEVLGNIAAAQIEVSKASSVHINRGKVSLQKLQI